MLKQRTIKTIVKTVGIGLHSGRKVNLTLRPAPANTGIVFARIDLAVPVDIPVSAMAIGDTRLASVLQKDGARVDYRAFDVGVCGTRDRQFVCRCHG